METHTDDYLDMEEEFEPIEGCNCIYCRMARMEKGMKELEAMVTELRVFLEMQGHETQVKGRGKA